VIGEDEARAQAILQDAGFEVAVKSVPRDSPEGEVFEQDPPAGSEVDEGSTVTLSVSAGLGTVVVPPVSGLPLRKAVKTLQGRGFRVNDERRFSSSVKRGRAIATLPPEDEAAERGSIVTLLVSRGPRLVTVPPVVGEQQDLAESTLRREGLIPDIEQRDSDEPVGEVIAQDPAAGSTVRKHTTVTVVVSTGAGSAIVPNVVGQSRQEARADLREAGLSVRISKRTTSDPNEDGQVLEQSPAAGTRLRQGEFVTVFVGKFSEPPPPTTPTTPTTPPPSP
jgi:serine/threonine-protein kinase